MADMADVTVHLISAVCLLYYLMIGLYAGFSADFIWIWPAAAAALELVRLYFKAAEARNWPSVYGTIINSGIALLLVLFVVLAGIVVKGMTSKAPAGCDYAVVLGAQVKGEKPSRSLRRRIESAVAYAEKNPGTIFILSGGQGPNEGISEAECMRREMVAAGVDETRLILEDKSVSTLENLIFSDAKSGCAQHNTGIITNSFHEARALMLARHCGYRQVAAIPGSSDGPMLVHFVVRETFAIVKEALKGNISIGGK